MAGSHETVNRLAERADGKPPEEPHVNGQAVGQLPPAADRAPDPYDDARCREALGAGHTDLGIEDEPDDVVVRKPSKEEFFRVHPDPEYRREVRMIVLKEYDRGVYWVDPSLWDDLGDEPTLKRVTLFTAVNNLGELFLWPVPVHEQLDREAPSWITIPTKAAKKAEEVWVMLFWNDRAKKYKRRLARKLTTEPRWSPLPMTQLIRAAFAERTITSLDHPTIQRLREGVVQEVTDDDDD
jgi:hypothetical protein